MVTAGVFLAGVVFVLVLQRLEIMVLNCGAAKRRRCRIYPLAAEPVEPVWQLPTTPMPPPPTTAELEDTWLDVSDLLRHDDTQPLVSTAHRYEKLRALPTPGRHALPSQPRLAITSGDAS